MTNILTISLLALSVALPGCATTQSTGTYSGDAKAALVEAGNSMGAFVRKSLSKPMPAWEPAPSTSAPVVDKSSAAKAATPSAAVSALPPSNGVEVYSVAPAASSPDVSLTNEELNLKNPGQTASRN